MEPNEELPVEREIIAKDQGTDANPWPHPRPDNMTETHSILLKQFWSEGMTPTPMIAELATLCDLKPHEARRIVMHWMWSENFRVTQ